MTLDQFFGRTFVINLEHRRDRRKEMEAELKKSHIHAEFFQAVQVNEQEDWPSLGARGCFLSHYTILKRSMEEGLESVLILEDDVDFSPRVRALGAEVVRQIADQRWGFVYLGHNEATGSPAGVDEAASSEGAKSGEACVALVEWPGALMTAHFYAVHGTLLPRLVTFLEQVMSRPDGHPLGGRQHVDGAYSMFRAQNPDVRTLIALPVLGSQRSSRSSVTLSTLDSLPLLGGLMNVVRRLRRRKPPL